MAQVIGLVRSHMGARGGAHESPDLTVKTVALMGVAKKPKRCRKTDGRRSHLLLGMWHYYMATHSGSPPRDGGTPADGDMPADGGMPTECTLAAPRPMTASQPDRLPRGQMTALQPETWRHRADRSRSRAGAGRRGIERGSICTYGGA